jgi:hypothetical protein
MRVISAVVSGSSWFASEEYSIRYGVSWPTMTHFWRTDELCISFMNGSGPTRIRTLLTLRVSPPPSTPSRPRWPVAQVAADLDISDQSIYSWRRQHLIDTGRLPGLTSSEHAELVAGSPVDQYKELWEYRDDIDFEF